MQLHGPYDMYGFFFACYDLMQVVGSPVFGFLADKVPINILLIVSCLINMTGNIVYAMGMNYGHNTALAGRMIAGFASGNSSRIISYDSQCILTGNSGNISAIMAYLATSSESSLSEVFVTLRGWLFFGRFAGPCKYPNINHYPNTISGRSVLGDD
jgi:MFS family permease